MQKVSSKTGHRNIKIMLIYFLESTVEYLKIGRPLCDILRELWWSYVGLVNDTLGTLTEVIECYHMHHIILYHLALSSVIHLLG